MRVILRRRPRWWGCAGGPPTRARARAQAGASYRNWSACGVGAPGPRHGSEPGRAGGWCGCANTAQSGGQGRGQRRQRLTEVTKRQRLGAAHLCLVPPKRALRHVSAMGGPTPRQALSSSLRVAGAFTSCAGASGVRRPGPPAYAAAIRCKQRPPRCTLHSRGALGSPEQTRPLSSPLEGALLARFSTHHGEGGDPASASPSPSSAVQALYVLTALTKLCCGCCCGRQEKREHEAEF